jgi:biopolymer transport protein ExbB/TolQ
VAPCYKLRVRPEHRKPLIGVLAGAALAVLGPLGGLLLTIILVQRSFGSVDAVAPSHKANVLASGISESMNATAIGMGVGAVGVLILLASLVMLLRAKRVAGDENADIRAG